MNFLDGRNNNNKKKWLNEIQKRGNTKKKLLKLQLETSDFKPYLLIWRMLIDKLIVFSQAQSSEIYSAYISNRPASKLLLFEFHFLQPCIAQIRLFLSYIYTFRISRQVIILYLIFPDSLHTLSGRSYNEHFNIIYM